MKTNACPQRHRLTDCGSRCYTAQRFLGNTQECIMVRYLVFLVFLLFRPGDAFARENPSDKLKAGVSVATITPAERLWMAGYAGRNHPAEGKDQDLYVKALALE